MLRRIILALALLLAPAVVDAQALCGDSAAQTADGRLLGHFPYGDVPEDELVPAPTGFALSGCLVRREMLGDLARLAAAANSDPAARGRLYALSCHRGIIRQGSVFCKPRPDADAATRAISVAPAGHSEHTTGYALDFAVRPANGCPDAEACMAATPMARWLVANAPRYGFEMSFPGGNGQNVKWEPWHWRWVGTSASEPGAARARFIFAKARARFPARPAVDGVTVIRDAPVWPTMVNAPPFPTCTKKNRKKC
jgi:D-alanyl-D-alanine carboxypeptidase